MLILTIRTDKPEAEIGLYDNEKQLSYDMWQAHRRLAETLHARIRDLLAGQSKTLQDVEAIACYQGPGSFTGLRIGLATGNALAYSLEIPIAAEMDNDAIDWKTAAVNRLRSGESDKVAVPEYGAPVHITLPKRADGKIDDLQPSSV
jgi:tRNA threonylcarbamoyladenosine biosynthesis protein TsaB